MIQKRFHTWIFCILFLASTSAIKAQTIVLPNAYAHNDYWHKHPLMDALNSGFTYIEADVYLRKNKLIVAHFLPCLKMKRTLEALYLQPLLNYVQQKAAEGLNGKVKMPPLTLMIDIKSNANKTYEALIAELDKYKTILSAYENGQTTLRSVTIVITGHKPYQLIQEEDNRLAFMDNDLRTSSVDPSHTMFPIASCKYSKIIKWKGKGPMPDNDIHRLAYYVDAAHRNGSKVRLWASPENKKVWGELLKCNVDLINTNRLKSLRKFLLADMRSVVKRS